MLHLLVVDPSPIFLAGVQKRLLESLWAADLRLSSKEGESFELLRNERFDAVIWGVDTGKEGFLPQLATLLPATEIPVLVLCGLPGIQWISYCFELGFRGYIPKDLLDQQLVEAIKAVISQKRFLDCPYRKEVLDCYAPSLESVDLERSNHSGLLSLKDIELLSFLAFGFSPKEIAQQLNLSCKSVYQRQGALRQKLGFENIQTLILWACANLNQNLLPIVAPR